MATLQQIDRTRPMSVWGSNAVKVTDPELVELAERMALPQLMVCEELVGEVLKIDAAEVATFLDRISKPEWRASFETDLQCISEDMQGRPLLTTWISIEVFHQFLKDIADLQIHPRLTEAVREWEGRGARTINVDGYQLS